MNLKPFARSLLIAGACVAGGAGWYLVAINGQSSPLEAASSSARDAPSIQQERELPLQLQTESPTVAKQDSFRESGVETMPAPALATGAETSQAQVTQANAPARVDPPTRTVQGFALSNGGRASVAGPLVAHLPTTVRAQPAPASLPVIFNDRALEAVALAPDQVAQVQQMREAFIEQIGPQNIYDAAYLVRWQQAHANTNDALRARFGWTIYSALLAESVAAGN